MIDKCTCELCRNELPFDLPEEVINALLDNDLVLFAGAGISTETSTVFKETLYEEIYNDLELKEEILFPDLMQKFCDDEINGRQKLLEKIKYRFDYCHQFNELYREASRFHKTIAPIWMLKNIITTNWDDYFERECGAIPIVSSEDFAFYNIDQRKVFKIHGSISNYGSVIATTKDYNKCYRELNKGIIGSSMKTMLATKTILFVGYSFRDFDFMRVLNYLKKELKDVHPHIYIVTLDENINKSLKGFDSTIINTDGTYFFSTIKKHLENQKYILRDDQVDRIYELEYLRHVMHKQVSDELLINKFSSLIYCAFYQDGIQHAIDYFKFKSRSGESYNPFLLMKHIDSYKQIRKDLSKAKNYADLAYVDGYIETLYLPFYDDFEIEDFPLFYLFGEGPLVDVEFFWDCIKNKEVLHKSSEKFAKKHFKHFLDENSELVAHHRPFIF